MDYIPKHYLFGYTWNPTRYISTRKSSFIFSPEAYPCRETVNFFIPWVRYAFLNSFFQGRSPITGNPRTVSCFFQNPINTGGWNRFRPLCTREGTKSNRVHSPRKIAHSREPNWKTTSLGRKENLHSSSVGRAREYRRRCLGKFRRNYDFPQSCSNRWARPQFHL